MKILLMDYELKKVGVKITKLRSYSIYL